MHTFDDTARKLALQAIASVPKDMKIVVSCKNGTPSKDLKWLPKEVIVVADSEGDSFAELINAAVDSIEDKWFSILEFDDTYTDNWFDNVDKYISFYPDVSVFMPLEDIVDFTNGNYVAMGNEAPWASSFSNEIGYIDVDCLQNFYDFYPTGSVFNTADWKEVKGLKPSIKITFWYEWMLRATNKGKKIFVVPKVGYIHMMNRDGSLTQTYKNETSQEEIQWWFDLAKRDYFFDTEQAPSHYVYNKE